MDIPEGFVSAVTRASSEQNPHQLCIACTSRNCISCILPHSMASFGPADSLLRQPPAARSGTL
eukprot:7327943-Alexandrium_andersonii.AAC.1